MEVVRLKAQDYDEAIDFLDLVFGKAHMTADFEKILPIIYRPTDEHMNCNFAVRENGKIRGIVGLFPTEMKVGDNVLKLGGIGGVSVHPKDKGKGWMKLLMGKAIEEMENTGVDISWLGGLRQRYQYFGYEKTGFMLEYKVSQTNIRHVFGESHATGIKLVRMESQDTAYIEKAKELHDRQPVACVRKSEDFWLFLTAVFATPWGALDESGKMVGYMVVDREQEHFTEIFAENDKILLDMVRTWLYQQKTEYVKVLLAPWQEKEARRIGMLAGNFEFKGNGNFRIFNWKKVVGSFLEVKNQMEPLMPGNLRIGIEDYGTLDISVENGKVTCRKVELEADFRLDAFAASRVLFGYCPVKYVTNIEMEGQKKMLLDIWFPLPLCWIPQNHV